MSVHIGSTEPARREGGDASRRVLIVHGDAETRQTIARGLAYEMLEIVEATDSRAAIDCLGGDPIDLILLDMGGPEAGGIQLLRLLKGDSHTHAIPVIVIAGADEGDGRHPAAQRLLLAAQALPGQQRPAVEQQGGGVPA